MKGWHETSGESNRQRLLYCSLIAAEQNKTIAAQAIGVTRQHLNRLLKTYGGLGGLASKVLESTRRSVGGTPGTAGADVTRDSAGSSSSTGTPGTTARDAMCGTAPGGGTLTPEPSLTCEPVLRSLLDEMRGAVAELAEPRAQHERDKAITLSLSKDDRMLMRRTLVEVEDATGLVLGKSAFFGWIFEYLRANLGGPTEIAEALQGAQESKK